MATAKKKTTAPKVEAQEEVVEETEVKEEVTDNKEGERYSGGPIPKVSPSEQSEN